MYLQKNKFVITQRVFAATTSSEQRLGFLIQYHH
jgi:hypothetical protein